MKINRNKIIIIVCILLVVLLIYLNRKNLKELFNNNFSEYHNKHEYNKTPLHNNKYRFEYKLTNAENEIKEWFPSFEFDKKLIDGIDPMSNFR